MSSEETDVQQSRLWLLLRNVLGIVNIIELTDLHALFCASLNFIRSRIPTVGKIRFFFQSL